MNNYPALLNEVKDRIRRAQIRATMSANAEMMGWPRPPKAGMYKVT